MKVVCLHLHETVNLKFNTTLLLVVCVLSWWSVTVGEGLKCQAVICTLNWDQIRLCMMLPKLVCSLAFDISHFKAVSLFSSALQILLDL